MKGLFWIVLDCSTGSSVVPSRYLLFAMRVRTSLIRFDDCSRNNAEEGGHWRSEERGHKPQAKGKCITKHKRMYRYFPAVNMLWSPNTMANSNNSNVSQKFNRSRLTVPRGLALAPHQWLLGWAMVLCLPALSLSTDLCNRNCAPVVHPTSNCLL